jgi:uncharacterized cupredoxin-like copper-binding protein
MSRKLVLVALAAVGFPILVAVTAGCGGDDDHGSMMGDGGMMSADAPAGSIRVDLLNWEVRPAVSTTKTGQVTFFAVHDMGHMHGGDEGGVIHDLQVMRKRPDGSLELVGQVQGLKMGQSKALTLDLPPGDYELSCNVVEEINGKTIPHYPKGMKTPFTVTA